MLNAYIYVKGELAGGGARAPRRRQHRVSGAEDARALPAAALRRAPAGARAAVQRRRAAARPPPRCDIFPTFLFRMLINENAVQAPTNACRPSAW